MVSRSLEKMMLIAVGLSTVVIVGVPVLMYAIDTINVTSELQEFHLTGEQIHNATRNVDQGYANSTTITVWMSPRITVVTEGYQLVIQYVSETAGTVSLTETYSHDITIDYPFAPGGTTALYSIEIALVDNVIHISFFEVLV
ncbi:MAG: hypothetical protein ACFFCP_00735 [Promethearchaeota archaeon]